MTKKRTMNEIRQVKDTVYTPPKRKGSDRSKGQSDRPAKKSRIQRNREYRERRIAKQMEQQFLKGVITGMVIGILMGVVAAAVMIRIV